MSNDVDQKAFLLFVLDHFQMEVLDQQGKYIMLKNDYMIEIENGGVLKLLHDGLVVAPFSDAEELCSFLINDPTFDE